MRGRVGRGAGRFRRSGLRCVGSPMIVRFLKLPSSSSLGRSGLRSTVVSGLRGFLVRVKGNCTLMTHRRRVQARRGSCCVSLMFCGCLVGDFVLMSLGIGHVACRSMKRVSVCLRVCSGGGGKPSSGPAVNVVLYARASSSITQCSALTGGSRVFTTGCGLCLPSGRSLEERVRQRGRLCLVTRPRRGSGRWFF